MYSQEKKADWVDLLIWLVWLLRNCWLVVKTKEMQRDFTKNRQRQSVAEVDAVVISREMENLENDQNLDQTAVKRIISS